MQEKPIVDLKKKNASFNFIRDIIVRKCFIYDYKRVEIRTRHTIAV